MADTDDTSKIKTRLEQTLEEQRAQLMQAHGVLACLHEALLYAEDKDAIDYAQATDVAASLVNDTVENLDPLRVKPLIDELIPNSLLRVEEPRVVYLR
jgi:hypothetical protein